MTRGELTVAHESGHLAAAVLLDLRPIRAEITPNHPERGGAVITRPLGGEDFDIDKARRVAVFCLAGPAAGGAGDLPRWPLSESASTDEALVARITKALRFDEQDYAELEDEVWDLTFSPPFQRAFTASETLLRMYGAIDREGIAIVESYARSGEAERELEACAA